MNKEIESLKNVCKPVLEYLKKNYNPHCSLIITDTYIRLVEDKIGIPVENLN
jgi:hypothetical protein